MKEKYKWITFKSKGIIFLKTLKLWVLFVFEFKEKGLYTKNRNYLEYFVEKQEYTHFPKHPQIYIPINFRKALIAHQDINKSFLKAELKRNRC